MKKLLFVLLIFTSLCVKAQENTSTNPAISKLQTIAASLDSFRRKVPVEKVHLHFDKPYYSLGDTIWIKAYVVIQSNELSALSQILHADLIDDKDSVRVSLHLPLTNGFGWGSIVLDDTLLQAGNYHIRAYTNIMRNLGETYFFNKAVMIGNAMPPKSIAQSSPSKKAVTPKNIEQPAPVNDDPAAITVQFFPEGGDLVNNITSKVGFKAVGANGLSREISGYIADKDNKQVATFQSEHAGMGAFMLQPAADNTYTAVIKLAGGAEKRIELPKAAQQGLALSVTQSDDNIIVNIQASNSLLNTGDVSLVAQANNIVQYTGEKSLTTNSITTVIPKNRFPEGITQFTLFGPDYQPVAERLVFIHDLDNHLKINLVQDKPGYAKRDKAHFDIQVTDRGGKPIVGTFSMAVTDEGKVPYQEANETTIFSNLLLTSDLKGYVEQPNYYFTDNNSDKDRQLDNLVLTQGWRKFIWKDIMGRSFPTLAFHAEEGFGLNGRIVTDKKKPTPVVGGRVSLLINIGGGIILDTTTNAQGRFSFNKFPFRKGTTFNVMATDAKGKKNVKVELDEPTPQAVTLKNLPLDQSENKDFSTYLENSRQRFDELDKNGLLRSITLKEVVIKEKITPETIKEVAVKNSENLAGAGMADQVLTFIDLLGCQSSLHDCLVGRVITRFGLDALYVVVDGIGGREISSVVSSDVSSVEVLRGGGAAALYGMHGSNGVLIITTKRGDVDYTAYETEHRTPGYNKPEGLPSYSFKVGYDLRKQFYEPDYANPKTNTQIPDLRTTIFWKPNVNTDETGKAAADFFNADGTGNYKVIIEGLDLYGRLGRQVFHYTVK